MDVLMFKVFNIFVFVRLHQPEYAVSVIVNHVAGKTQLL